MLLTLALHLAGKGDCETLSQDLPEPQQTSLESSAEANLTCLEQLFPWFSCLMFLLLACYKLVQTGV